MSLFRDDGLLIANPNRALRERNLDFGSVEGVLERLSEGALQRPLRSGLGPHSDPDRDAVGAERLDTEELRRIEYRGLPFLCSADFRCAVDDDPAGLAEIAIVCNVDID